jgi:hypothetical protein
MTKFVGEHPKYTLGLVKRPGAMSSEERARRIVEQYAKLVGQAGIHTLPQRDALVRMIVREIERKKG